MAHFWEMTLLVETTVSFSELRRLKQAVFNEDSEEKTVLQAVIPERYSENKLEQELYILGSIMCLKRREKDEEAV